MAGRYTFRVVKGGVVRRTFRFKVKSTGDPINLTGYTATLQVHHVKDDDTVLLDADATNGMVTVSGPAGEVSLEIPGETTDALPVGTHHFAFALIDSSGEGGVLIEGPFKVRLTPWRRGT